MTVRIEEVAIAGWCPVQADGVLSTGHRFYFRARNSAWTVYVWRPEHDRLSDETWVAGWRYGSFPDAGWMSEAHTRRLLRWVVRLWANGCSPEGAQAQRPPVGGPERAARGKHGRRRTAREVKRQRQRQLQHRDQRLFRRAMKAATRNG